MRLVSLAFLAGCAPALQPAPARPVCGWEAIDDPAERGAPKLEVRGSAARAPAGTSRLVVLAGPDEPFGSVRAALAPAAGTLVRVKIAIDGKYLLPLTIPGRPAEWPEAAPKTVQIVGTHKVTRVAEAPALRMADLVLEPGSVRLALESDSARGRPLGLGELADALRHADPRIETFALRASDSAPWRDVTSAVVAAACYDRGAGDEPHEILLDLELKKP